MIKEVPFFIKNINTEFVNLVGQQEEVCFPTGIVIEYVMFIGNQRLDGSMSMSYRDFYEQNNVDKWVKERLLDEVNKTRESGTE